MFSRAAYWPPYWCSFIERCCHDYADPYSIASGEYVPCVDGSELARLFFTFAGWSVQPCVRPVCAVHMTAGHNAFRGSGPGQKPAFEMHWHKWVVLIAGSTGSALRAVGPPNFLITPDVGAISVMPQARRVPCSDHPWPLWPTPFLRSCWQARSRPPWWAAAPTMP